MRVAVVNMPAVFADVRTNMDMVSQYVEEAAEKNAEIIVFPEFFTTGFALDRKLIHVAIASRNIEQMIMDMSKEYNIAIGGSYLYPDFMKNEIYNRFGLFFPTGEKYFHCKDIPTAIENFCYTDGDETSAFDTPLGRIGIAICWEQLRCRTMRRMAGKVDYIIAGSCWWGFAPEDGEKTYAALHDYNKELAENAPIHMSEILGVPVIHSSHIGSFEGLSMMPPVSTCTREIESRTLVTDGAGHVIINPEASGCYVTDIEPGCIKDDISISEHDYWVTKMPDPLVNGFDLFNTIYKKQYKQYVKPLLQGDESYEKK